MAYTFRHGDRPLEGITIQRAVGRGGFGEVYYALTDSGKQVAVKYLRDNPEAELRGVAHVMNLKSPYLITIYDVRNNEEKEPFVIMEYVAGPSLRELMDAEPRGLGLQKAAFFLTGIAKGLSYLHERGIVHRDLKPGNIFYDDGYVKIGDYGLSKHMSVSRHSGQTVSVGTVHYMAPEIGSGSYTKAIDIYALGVILYEMITGRLPFTGSSMGEILMRHLNERPDTTGIPEPFATVIARALAKNPQDRFQSVDEMVDAVMSVAEFNQSVSSFDPRTLSSVPRRPEASDDRTMTTPPRRVAPPPLDVRDFSGDLPPIPPIPPLPGAREREEYTQPHDSPARIHVLLNPLSIVRGTAGWVRGILGNFVRYWPQAVCALIVCAAVGVGSGFLLERGGGDRAIETGVLLAMMLVSTVTSTLFCYGVLLSRIPKQTEVVDRIVFAAAGLIAMLPWIAAAADERPALGAISSMTVPLCAVLFLFNWSERIEDGRKLRLKGHSAAGPAGIGLVAAAIAGMGGGLWIGAAICGGFAYAVQLAAAVLPSPRPRPSTQPPDFEPNGGIKADAARLRQAVRTAASGFVFRAGFRPGQQTWGQPPQSTPIGVDPPTIGAPPPPIPPAQSVSPPPSVEAPIVIDAAQPSFVGRTANAGMAFLGKFLLIASVAGAVLYHAESLKVDLGEGNSLAVADGTIAMTTREDGSETARRVGRITPVAIFLPMMAGIVFLVTSRRNSGAGHVTRGIFGCVAALAAGILALGPASQAWAALFRTGDISRASPPGPFFVSVGMIACALLLLNWPRRRSARTIVV